MPQSLNHALFARTHQEDCVSAGSRVAMIHLGTQGPDPFYFKGKLPWRYRTGSQRVEAFADFAHDCPPGEFFGPLAGLMSQVETKDQPALWGFLFGLTLHYALDTMVHPYVYDRSGFDAHGRLSGRFGADHGRFETGMTEATVQNLDLDKKSTSPRSLLTADSRDLAMADDFLARAFPEHLRPGDYQEGWLDMVDSLALLWDPLHVKRRLLELLGMGESRERGFIRPGLPKNSQKVDFLNLCHGTWYHPVSGEPQTSSVPDLISQAHGVATRAAKLIDSIALGQDPHMGWHTLAENRNHEGCRPGERLRIHHSIYISN